MTDTTRTIEQILTNRLRAAELRVMERAMATLKATEDQELAKAIKAKQLAEEAVVLVRREIDAQQGLPVEPVPYAPETTFATQRYAAVLMLDHPGMTREQALAAAAADESARFENWFERHGEA